MERSLRSFELAVVAAAAIWLAACASPIRTSYDMDPNANMASYATYAWIEDGPLIGPSVGEARPSHISPIDDQRIRAAVDREMAARGYSRVAKGQGDMVISYSVGTEDKMRVRSSPSYGSYYGGYGYGGWYGSSQVSVDQYTEGTLSIEFWDESTKQAVWVGWASKRLSRDRDDNASVIDEAVTKILVPLAPRS